MRKLYRTKASGELEYHEAWDANGCVVEHWGRVGERGSTREHKPGLFRRVPTIDKVLAKPMKLGFREFDDEEMSTLLVEYEIDGFGSEADLEKRHGLEARLNEILGWTGLGHCDGGSIGSGSMEACCFVVDFEIAKSTVSRELEGSEFDDYTRIYDEDVG